MRAVLNVIADFTDLNIITSDTVGGNLTLRLKDVPWDQALEIILQTRGLDSRRSGNVIWIAPRDELATREKLALESQQQINDLEQTRTESFQMNYQKAADVQKLLSDATQRILSKRGSAVVDARTNTLFVQDTPSRLEDVRKLIAKIDVPVRQVMIEARIVEANDSFSKSLGARIGYHDLRPYSGRIAAGSNPATAPRFSVGGNLDDVGGHAGGGAQGGDPSFIPGSLASNMPAVGFNGFPAGQFSFILFNAAATTFLNLEITAAEADGRGKIIASPRVLTADQVEALIEQGTEIPYQQASSSGATAVSFRKASLSLKVKPQITPDGNVIMTLDVNKDQPGAQTAGRRADQHQARQDRGAGRERRHGRDRRHLRAERPHRQYQGAVLRRPAVHRCHVQAKHHHDQQDRAAGVHYAARRDRKAHGSLIAASPAVFLSRTTAGSPRPFLFLQCRS